MFWGNRLLPQHSSQGVDLLKQVRFAFLPLTPALLASSSVDDRQKALWSLPHPPLPQTGLFVLTFLVSRAQQTSVLYKLSRLRFSVRAELKQTDRWFHSSGSILKTNEWGFKERILCIWNICLSVYLLSIHHISIYLSVFLSSIYTIA